MNPSSQKEYLTKWQVICMVTLILSSEGIVTTGYKLSDNGIWLSCLIATAVNVLVCIVYAFILQRNDGKSLFDVFESVFGKWIGKVFSLIFVIYAIFIAVTATKSIALQITDLSLHETPYFFILFLFMFVYAVTLFKGIEVTARMSCIFFVLILFTTAVCLVLVYSNLELFNFQPMLAAPMKEIALGGAQNYFIMFGDSAIMLGLVLSNKHPKKKKNNIFKGFLFGDVISGLLITLLIVVSIMVLGFPLNNYLFYPISMVLSTIDIALFITRIEVLASLFFLTASIIKSIVSMYVVTKGCQKIFATKQNTTYIIPVSIIVFVISLFMYESIEQVISFRDKYSWIKGFAQIVIPIVVATFLLFKKKEQPIIMTPENIKTALES